MVYWSVTLGYFSFHLVCLIIAYYQGNKSLKRRLTTKTILTHHDNNHINEEQANLNGHGSRSSHTLSAILNNEPQEEEKYSTKPQHNNNFKLSAILLAKQSNENNIDFELFSAFEMNESDKHKSSQTYISWPLLICLLYNISISTSIGIIFNWIYSINLNANLQHHHSNNVIYILCFTFVIYRVWSSYIIYKYTKSIRRLFVNLFIDFEVIYSFYITCKVNKYRHSSIIIPLSHSHVFLSSVISFWFVLFLVIYINLNENYNNNLYYLYLTCIIFNYISMLTAFTMDDTNRLSHGIDLQLIHLKNSHCLCGKLSMSPSYIFRIIWRHIDIIFRLSIFYSCIMTMGFLAFYCLILCECMWCLFNAYNCEFHYILDLYQCVMLSSVTLIHKQNENKTQEELRRNAASYVCLQRLASHFLLILCITFWISVDFECVYCPEYSARLQNMSLAIYILLWILLVLYAIFWTFPVNVLNGNVSLKMLKINGADIETLKDSVFYGIIIPNLTRSQFKIHPLQLYLFLTKQYDIEFIEKIMLPAQDRDYWQDNMLHNLCCNAHSPLQVINILDIKYGVLWNEVNKDNLCAIHYYLQYNQDINESIIDLCINQCFTAIVSSFCDDNLLHKICKNASVSPDTMKYILQQNGFILLCYDLNKMNETPFHCYLKSNKYLSKRVIDRFMEIYLDKKKDKLEWIEYIDYWGNTFLHSICMNPKITISILNYFLSALPMQYVLHKNYLNIKAIQYIEANHCYPMELLQALERAMDIAKKYKEEEKEEYEFKKKEKKQKQSVLLMEKWYYDSRVNKPFGVDEIYFDFVECLDCVFSSGGVISWFQIRGIIAFRSDLSESILIHLLTNDLRNWRYSNMSIKKLQNRVIKYINLEYTAFHPCVNIHGWTKRRQIYFIPPNGMQFVLMSYRITSKYLDSNMIPFRCYTQINYIVAQKSINFKITFQNNINMQQPRYCAKLIIPLVRNKNATNIICNHGIYDIFNGDEATYIVWNIYNVQQHEPMIFEFNINDIVDIKGMNDWLSPEIGSKPVINIEFKFIKTYLFSSFNIEQYTAHDSNNKLKTLRIWKRKQAMNGHCTVQLT